MKTPPLTLIAACLALATGASRADDAALQRWGIKATNFG